MKMMVVTFTATIVTMIAGYSSATAQKYPDRPIKIVVPFPAGGATDVLARAIGERVRMTLGQPWIIENRPGANGTIGLQSCAASRPDGYTYCVLAADALTIMPHYDPTLFERYKTLVPVTQLIRAPAIIYAGRDLAAQDMREFVQLAKAKPGSLNYASFGVGSMPQLFFEWVNKKQGISVQHIPFKGSNDALSEVMAGRIQASYVALGLVVQQINAGSLKGLAVLGDERAPMIPNVPSLAELGFDYPLKGTWFGLAAPQGTSPEALEATAAAVRDAVHAPEFKEKFLDPSGYIPVGSSPAAFAETVKAETARGAELIQVTGIKAQQ